MKTSRTSAAVAALLLALICRAGAQEQKFDKNNFAITPPDGWKQGAAPAQPGMVAMFVNPGKTAVLILGTVGTSTMGGDIGPSQMTDAFVSEFNKGVENGGGGKFLSGKFVEVAGIKSYERIGQIVANGKTSSTLMQVVPAGATLYSLNGIYTPGDALQESELRKSMATFRFLTPPVIPVASEESQSPSYKMGLLAGKVFVGLFVLIVIIRLARR